MVSEASAYGWTSPTLPKLLSEDSAFRITPDESSWIVSLMVLGQIFGPIPSSLLVDRVGRKMTLIITSIPLIIGWILIVVANSASTLFVSRFLSGISYGMAYATMPMYLGEISSDDVRGSIGTLLTVMAKLGILIAYAIGPYVSFNAFALILLVIPIIFISIFVWLPESPYYLVSTNKVPEAVKSLVWLRGHKNVNSELQEIEIAVKKCQENKGTLRELFQIGNRRALIIALGLGACQQLCGSQAIVAYSTQLFKDVGSQINASEVAIIMGVVQLLTAMISAYVVDKLGRRPLLLISTIGVTICNFIIAVYFYLKLSKEMDVTDVSWIPIVAIMFYIFSYTIGLSAVVFAILGEIFPTNVKAIAVAVSTINNASIGFGVTKLYQIVNDSLGIYVTFFGFACFSFFFVIFVWFLLPETKGKSLADILVELNSSKKK